MIRRGSYKLHIDYETLVYEGDQCGALELYDLKKDPGERNDLAGKMPEKARQLYHMHKHWLKSVDAQMMTKNPLYRPAQDTEK